MSDVETRLANKINDALTEFNADTDGVYFPTGWVLLVSALNALDPLRSGVSITYSDQMMPWATALGIVEAGKLRLSSAFLTGVRP